MCCRSSHFPFTCITNEVNKILLMTSKVAAAPTDTLDLLGNKVSAFLGRVTDAANSVIDGTTLTGALVTPVSVDALRQEAAFGSGGHPNSNGSGGNNNNAGPVVGTSVNGNGQLPWVIKGQYISVHQQPIRAFTAATARSIHNGIKATDFDIAYKNAVESQRLMQSAHRHLSTVVTLEDVNRQLSSSSGSSHSSIVTPKSLEAKPDSTISECTFQPAPSSVNGILLKRLRNLCENNGVSRSQIASNAVWCKKMAERGDEALTVAMSRGLLRRQNDEVGYLGRRQTVGDIDELDIASVDREREELALIMATYQIQNELAVENYHRMQDAKKNAPSSSSS